ncbi:hypothetical protein GUJ93_ZPchr0012g21120 [Zizania palustris]|uniref:Protein MIZU-KUSSEI 1 n=1 Tax=Zizania palustris TaxID=103762 RepID=A0A8J5WNR6_ZIZPA|nr:hypothetical protein GUJ93_ZPchr0012g21120 [Zizania palustris]
MCTGEYLCQPPSSLVLPGACQKLTPAEPAASAVLLDRFVDPAPCSYGGFHACMRAGGEAVMARALHASAAPSPRASPLPSSGSWSPFSRGGGGGMGGLPWLLGKRGNGPRHGRTPLAAQLEQAEDGEEDVASYFVSTPYSCSSTPYSCSSTPSAGPSRARKRGEALARLRSAILSVLGRSRRGGRGGARSRMFTGTIFGRLRGRAHLALQTDPRAAPTMILELAAYSTGALVREMASGVVRLALECEKAPANTGDPLRCSYDISCLLRVSHNIHPLTRMAARIAGEKRRVVAPLLEETTWRAYCNGRKCGYALRRECGAEEWRVLRAVEPVSVGAGVLPDGGGAAGEGDMMYMRVRFERVVGSKDSEALYMVNPDGNGGHELSIFLLRV